MADVLFYDGKCPLCAGEIDLLARFKRDSLTLVDIHSSDKQLLTCGVPSKTLLAVLHLKTADGEWRKGLDATVTAWRHTPFGWLLSPLRWPVLNRVANRVYYRWASKRACRLGYSNA